MPWVVKLSSDKLKLKFGADRGVERVYEKCLMKKKYAVHVNIARGQVMGMTLSVITMTGNTSPTM